MFGLTSTNIIQILLQTRKSYPHFFTTDFRPSQNRRTKKIMSANVIPIPTFVIPIAPLFSGWKTRVRPTKLQNFFSEP
jgi:hypothetical protein